MLELIATHAAIYYIVNAFTNFMLNKQSKNDGNVPKSKRKTKPVLIVNSILGLIPYFNLGMAGLGLLTSSLSLVNKKCHKIVMSGFSHTPEHVKFNYERNTSKNDMEDAMTLDGASDEEIKKEIKAFKNKCVLYATKEKSYFGASLDDDPFFTENDYDLACAQIDADRLLFEISCNVELSNREKRKLLALLRKDYLKAIKDIKKNPSQIVEEDEIINEEVIDTTTMIPVLKPKIKSEREILEDTSGMKAIRYALKIANRKAS